MSPCAEDKSLRPFFVGLAVVIAGDSGPILLRFDSDLRGVFPDVLADAVMPAWVMGRLHDSSAVYAPDVGYQHVVVALDGLSRHP